MEKNKKIIIGFKVDESLNHEIEVYQHRNMLPNKTAAITKLMRESLDRHYKYRAVPPAVEIESAHYILAQNNRKTKK